MPHKTQSANDNSWKRRLGYLTARQAAINGITLVGELLE